MSFLANRAAHDLKNHLGKEGDYSVLNIGKMIYDRKSNTINTFINPKFVEEVRKEWDKNHK